MIFLQAGTDDDPGRAVATARGKSFDLLCPESIFVTEMLSNQNQKRSKNIHAARAVEAVNGR
jgi:hypothetical protein